jgi:hypothetical protein
MSRDREGGRDQEVKHCIRARNKEWEVKAGVKSQEVYNKQGKKTWNCVTKSMQAHRLGEAFYAFEGVHVGLGVVLLVQAVLLIEN